ncbi:hypothetical protein GQ457_14G015680 [Hibiscus cannabinus]
MENYLQAKEELHKLLDIQEAYWAQRSRNLWLAHGDKNTKFFHARANRSDQILNNIKTSVTPSMNEALSKPFTPEEITTAFRNIDPRKAPGIDGFFDIDTQSIQSFKHAPTKPISLCTVIYKIISKVLVNRMKTIIPCCISSNQAAFIQDRNITDNILIAHELIQTLHTGSTKLLRELIKLDMEKAFDRVEWNFLEQVLYRMGRPTLSFSFPVCTQGLSALLHSAQQSGTLSGLLEVIPSQRSSINSILQFREVDDPGIYLGVPLLIGKNKTTALGFARDKVHSRISQWDKIFSHLVVEKFLLKLLSKPFLNMRKQNKKGWHLLPWDMVCHPKSAGGIVFVIYHLFNIALLGKQIWRLICHPEAS